MDHRHAYWLLAEPVSLDDVERLNRRIAYALGADAASTDCARILRAPSSLNHKHITPASVIMDRCDPHGRHALGDISRIIPFCSHALVMPRSGHGRRPNTEDSLLTVSPRIYVEQLTGIRVPRGGKIRCPFHDDHTPSLHVYDDAERGWYCFGCRRGGSIYDFAASLSGQRTRGADFAALRLELLRVRWDI